MNAHRYPVWASLARNHFAVVASSVSSEWAFLSAGITISKCHSCLKGDIVEALQFLKCLIHQDLIFCADHSESLDTDLDEEDKLFEDNVGLSAPEIEKSTLWDDVWLEDKDDKVIEG